MTFFDDHNDDLEETPGADGGFPMNDGETPSADSFLAASLDGEDGLEVEEDNRGDEVMDAGLHFVNEMLSW